MLSDTLFRHLHRTPVKSMHIFKVSCPHLKVRSFLACKSVVYGLDCGVGCKRRRVSTWAVHVKHLSLPLRVVTPPCSVQRQLLQLHPRHLAEYSENAVHISVLCCMRELSCHATVFICMISIEQHFIIYPQARMPRLAVNVLCVVAS
jgi:hypothetical protein